MLVGVATGYAWSLKVYISMGSVRVRCEYAAVRYGKEVCVKELKEGSKAPAFSLKDRQGKPVSLGALTSDFTVLYFYPKDNTPGCTIEAQEFSKALREFATKKAIVIGVSGGDEKTKTTFCKKYGLTVTLVSDSDFKVSRAYGVYGDKKFMGRVFKGIHRKTFVVDKKGVIRRVFSSVKPEGHAKEVLAAIDQLRASSKLKTSGKKVAGVRRISAPTKTRKPVKKTTAKNNRKRSS